MKKLMFVIMMIFMLCACSNDKVIFEEKDSLKIAVATDLHYFAQEYYKDCEWFEESMLYADGKMTTYGDEIIDAFINDVIEKKADMVVLTGDLTFNGEVNSHKLLAEKLQKLEENGISVVVTAGNHDVENVFTKGYGKDAYFDVDSLDGQEFKNVYSSLGYDLASSKHKESLSYEVILNNDYSLFLLDTNNHSMTGGSPLNTGGTITKSTQEWLTDRLEKAKEKGRTPIVAMHHNLGIHSEMMNKGFTIEDNQKMIDLLKEYNTPLVLSGHIHLQSVIDVEGIKEIVTTSLVDNPLQYGFIELTDEKIKYETYQLKISVDPAEYFDTVSSNKFYRDEKDINKDLEREAIVLANRHYFAGTIKDVKEEIMNMKGYSLIINGDNERYKNYIQSMLESDGEYTKLEINVRK